MLHGIVVLAVAAPMTPMDSPWIRFACDDGYRFRVRMLPSEAKLDLPDKRALVLPRVAGAAGEVYGDAAWGLSVEGETAVLTLAGRSRTCKVV